MKPHLHIVVEEWKSSGTDQSLGAWYLNTYEPQRSWPALVAADNETARRILATYINV